MNTFKTEQEVVHFLQGLWSTEDGRIKFEIIDKELKDIVGTELDLLRNPVLSAIYELEKDDYLDNWLITCPAILAESKNPIVFKGEPFPEFSIMTKAAIPKPKIKLVKLGS